MWDDWLYSWQDLGDSTGSTFFGETFSQQDAILPNWQIVDHVVWLLPRFSRWSRWFSPKWCIGKRKYLSLSHKRDMTLLMALSLGFYLGYYLVGNPDHRRKLFDLKRTKHVFQCPVDSWIQFINHEWFYVVRFPWKYKMLVTKEHHVVPCIMFGLLMHSLIVCFLFAYRCSVNCAPCLPSASLFLPRRMFFLFMYWCTTTTATPQPPYHHHHLYHHHHNKTTNTAKPPPQQQNHHHHINDNNNNNNNKTTNTIPI